VNELISGTIDAIRQDQSGPAEEPEQAFRRGYHHGAFIVAEAIKGRVDPVLWQTLNAFAHTVSKWRTAWYERKRRRPAPKRVHSAPEPNSLLYGNSAAGADQLWGVLRYQSTAAGKWSVGGDFSGWHSLAGLAQAIHTDWRDRYPDWNVVLMVQNNARRSANAAKQAMAVTQTTAPGSVQLPPSPTSH
jgi:hypothetical protein